MARCITSQAPIRHQRCLAGGLAWLVAASAAWCTAGDDVPLNECEKAVVNHPFDPASCFDKVWSTIQEGFWDPNYNGVDWNEARARYRPRALAAADHEAFATVVNQMLGELKTSHTQYYTRWDPDYYTLQAALISQSLAMYATSDTGVLEENRPGLYSSSTKPQRARIGVVTKEIEGRHYVSYVLASTPAEKAGIVLGDWLVQVDGQPFHPVRSFEGKAGRTVEVQVQRGPAASTRRCLTMQPILQEERRLFEDDASARTRIMEHQGRRLAYTRLCWLSGWRIRGIFDWCLELADRSEGIIIDVRDGFGGGPCEDFIDPFLRKGLEDVVNESFFRDQTLRSRPVFNGPIVLLINGGSRSGKELLAYYFQKTGRAVLVGERTAGHVSGGRWKRISPDSMLYYCASKLIIDGKVLEGVGVKPDVAVPCDIRFAQGKDIQLERAKDEIVRRLTSTSGRSRMPPLSRPRERGRG